MPRVETHPSARGRRNFAAPARGAVTLFGIAALLGLANCADDPLSPHRADSGTGVPAARFPRFNAGENPDSLPPGSFFISMPVSPGQTNTGVFTKTVFASYGVKTRVEIVAAGLVGKKRITTGVMTWIDPRGQYVDGCYSYVIADFRKAGNVSGGGWAGLCSARLTDTIVVEGTGTAERTPGYRYAGTTCGAAWQAPCYTYSGEHSVRLRPVAKQLELMADPSQVISGSQVRFTARRKDGKPFTVVLWLWKPLSPVVGANGSTTYGPTASGCTIGLPTCDVVMTNTQLPEDPSMTPQRGLMYVRAVVDGVEETAKAEVTVFRDLPPVVVNLPSGESTLPPVFSRFFSGVAQTWTGHLYSSDARRRDVIELPVSAVFDTTFYDWVRIHFSSSVADGSGGHPHGLPGGPDTRRLSGGFFATRESAETMQGRTLDTATVELSGTTTSDTIVYRTSGVAGVEMVTMTATAKPRGTAQPRQVKSGVKSAVVMVNGLSALSWDGAYHRFSDQAHTRHGNINNYVNPSFSANLLAAFADYAALYDGAQLPRFIVDPQTGVLETKFVINDASLEWGGLLDSGSPEWANPHRLHRTGEDVDVRSRVFNYDRERRFMRICRERSLKCEVHTNPRHLHIQPASRSVP